jgi:predicted transcriptional regulator
MRTKRVRIAVEPLADTEVRWKKALKGKARSSGDVITVPSWEVLAKILSPARLEMLARIPEIEPKSIAALARSLKRDFKNVYSDVMFLAEVGLVELRREGTRNTTVPIVRCTGIEVDFRRGAAA